MPSSSPPRALERLLRATERYTKTDMMYAFSGSAWLGIGQAGAAVAILLLAVVFANVLPKETYGTYKYVLSVATIIAAFSFSGLSTSVAQATARGDESALGHGFRTYLRTGLAMTVIAICVGGYYLVNGNHTLGIGVLIAGLALPLTGASNLYDSYLQGKKLFRISGMLAILNVAVPVLVLIGVVSVTHAPLPIIFAYFAGSALVDLALYIYVRRQARQPQGTENRTEAYSAHLSVMNIFTTFAAQVDQLLLFHVLGSVTLAVYAFAIAIPEQMKGLLKNVGALALPKFAERDERASRKDLVRKTLLFSAGIACLAVVYMAAAPYVFGILFPQYMASVPYSQTYVFALIGGSSVLPIAFLQARQETKKLYIVSIASACIQVGLIAVGGWYYGVMGVIIARISARVATAVISLLVAVR